MTFWLLSAAFFYPSILLSYVASVIVGVVLNRIVGHLCPKPDNKTGFYLGYLRDRNFPPKMPSFPPKNVVIITVYK